MIQRPEPNEYSTFAAGYVSLVPDGDFFEILEAQTEVLFRELRAVSEEQSLYRYAPGKWSLRESFLHVSDSERIFTYRALRVARNDQTNLPGYEQDDYIGPSEADQRSWASIVDELESVRGATLQLFRNLPAAAWARMGNANGNPVSTRALGYITVGHAEHHLRLLRERYLAPVSA
jgi:hypothetical protein